MPDSQLSQVKNVIIFGRLRFREHAKTRVFKKIKVHSTKLHVLFAVMLGEHEYNRIEETDFILLFCILHIIIVIRPQVPENYSTLLSAELPAFLCILTGTLAPLNKYLKLRKKIMQLRLSPCNPGSPAVFTLKTYHRMESTRIF